MCLQSCAELCCSLLEVLAPIELPGGNRIIRGSQYYKMSSLLHFRCFNASITAARSEEMRRAPLDAVRTWPRLAAHTAKTENVFIHPI